MCVIIRPVCVEIKYDKIINATIMSFTNTTTLALCKRKKCKNDRN